MTLTYTQVRSETSSSVLTESILSSISLSDDHSRSIAARAVACLLLHVPDASSGMCNPKIIAKLFDDFGIVTVQARVRVGCDAACSRSHDRDGACLMCGQSWGPHNGHTCPRSGTRGSWVLGGGSAQSLPVGNTSPVLTPLRMQGRAFTFVTDFCRVSF